MTPEQHNKYLGIGHIVYAGLTGLMLLVAVFWIGLVLSLEPGPNEPPVGLFVAMGIFMMVITVIMALPSLIAGIGLLKRRPWAKVAAIVAAVMAASSAPFGTAICAWTFWFLFSEPGKSIYEKPQHALPPMGAHWQTNSTRSSEQVYTPSSTPPDWR